MGVTYDELVARTVDWPGVTSGTWYGTPALKVAGKGFARTWSDREYHRDGIDDSEVLVVLCDPEEKAALIDAGEGLLFETPHYHGHGAVLIRLVAAGIEDVLGHVEESYRLKASPKHLAAFDRN